MTSPISAIPTAAWSKQNVRAFRVTRDRTLPAHGDSQRFVGLNHHGSMPAGNRYLRMSIEAHR